MTEIKISDVKKLFYPLNVEYISESDIYNITASTGVIHSTYQITRPVFLRMKESLDNISVDIKRRLDHDIKREIHKELLQPNNKEGYTYMGYEILIDSMAEDGHGKLVVSPNDFHMMLKERTGYGRNFEFTLFPTKTNVITNWQEELDK